MVKAYYGWYGILPPIHADITAGAFTVNIPAAINSGSCPPVMSVNALIVAGEPIGAFGYTNPVGRGPHSAILDHRTCSTLTADPGIYVNNTGGCQCTGSCMNCSTAGIGGATFGGAAGQ